LFILADLKVCSCSGARAVNHLMSQYYVVSNCSQFLALLLHVTKNREV